METDFSKYRHLGNIEDIYLAIKGLFELKDRREIADCFRKIDNCVIVQGRLYEAAFPVVQEMMERLKNVYQYNFLGLPFIIGFLADVSGGYNEEEINLKNDVKGNCINLIKSYRYLFFELLDSDNEFIRNDSVFILANCCLHEYDAEFFNIFYTEYLLRCDKYQEFNRINNLSSGFMYETKVVYLK